MVVVGGGLGLMVWLFVVFCEVWYFCCVFVFGFCLGWLVYFGCRVGIVCFWWLGVGCGWSV